MGVRVRAWQVRLLKRSCLVDFNTRRQERRDDRTFLIIRIGAWQARLSGSVFPKF